MNGCPQTVTVGRCRIAGGVIAVGDPCYLADPRFSLRLQNAKAGSWIVTIVPRRFEGADERVGELIVAHESVTEAAGLWRDSGAVVGVDSGHAAVCDARSLIGPDHAPVRSVVVLDHGVLSSTGFGDGVYPCFVCESGGEVVAVAVRFIDEDGASDDDADPCDLIGGPFDGYPVPEDEQARLYLYVGLHGRRVAVYEADDWGRFRFAKLQPIGEGVMPHISPARESEGGEA